jgi:hypothetical protein
LVGDLGVAFAPDEEDGGEDFEDTFLLEELYLLIGAVDIFSNFFPEETVSVLG